MRLLVAKLAVAGYLVMLAYYHSPDSLLRTAQQEVFSRNIEQLSVAPRTKEFLQLYLLRAILYAFYSSLLMVLSRNILPKLVCAAALALWSYFSVLPGLPLQNILLKALEENCIVGGLLFVAGSEYIEATLAVGGVPGFDEEKEKTE